MNLAGDRVFQHEINGRVETVRIALNRIGMVVSHSCAACDGCDRQIQPDEPIAIRFRTDVEQVRVGGWRDLAAGDVTIATPQGARIYHERCDVRLPKTRQPNSIDP